MEKLLHDLRVKIKSDLNITLSEQEDRITTKINENIDRKFDFVNKEIEKINQTNEDQEKRLTLLEKQIRERRLIFFGVEEGQKSYEELEDKVMATISEMGIECTQNEIEFVRRMGKPNEDKIRPINVALTTYGKKISILKNKNKLENTKIYIKEDFSPRILEVRKSLHEQLQKERSEGRQAYLRYDKIVIRGPSHSKQDEPLSSNTKKRELEITPPHQAGSSSAKLEISRTKYQTAKKNKVSSQGGQSSITNFVKKLNVSGTSSGPSSHLTSSTIDVVE
ncbi:putative endonuclease-reverse transcriptase [Operophtera brumata]|nr:putative endonuclease-reverse transcriptase [Operophtera brumata]